MTEYTGQRDRWNCVDTCPPPMNKLLILWAETSIDPPNWKMAIGSLNYQGWNWEGRWLGEYEVKPTHWMPLPEPPR